MANDTLADLLGLAIEFRDARDWKRFHNPKELAINLTLEAAELLELMQWRTGSELDQHLHSRQAELADELADVLHSVLLLADELKIDLADAFRRKMIHNAGKYPVERFKGSARKYNQPEEKDLKSQI